MFCPLVLSILVCLAGADQSKHFWTWDDQSCRIGLNGKEKIWGKNDHDTQLNAQALSWTYAPSCSFSNGTQYCTFTDCKFHHDRGITIVTSPEIAANISIGEASEHHYHSHANGQSYIARQIPGKGMGLVATRTLFPGDVIFAYPPASIHHNGMFKTMSAIEREFVLRESINSLPTETKKMWWNLDWQGSRVDLAEDIINTNSFRLLLGENKIAHSMMSPEMSRMNHDCRPNVRHRFSPLTFSHTAYAVRKINAGEELTISYLSPLQSYSQRQHALQHGWGFSCSCSLCSQNPAIRAASDDRIRMIKELKQMNLTPEMAEFMVSLYEQERLEGWIGVAYKAAALAWNEVNEFWKSKKYAALAVQQEANAEESGDEMKALLYS